MRSGLVPSVMPPVGVYAGGSALALGAFHWFVPFATQVHVVAWLLVTRI